MKKLILGACIAAMASSAFASVNNMEPSSFKLHNTINKAGPSLLLIGEDYSAHNKGTFQTEGKATIALGTIQTAVPKINADTFYTANVRYDGVTTICNDLYINSTDNNKGFDDVYFMKVTSDKGVTSYHCEAGYSYQDALSKLQSHKA